MHIFIAIPSAGRPHAWFTQSLASMVARATREGVTDGAGKLVQPVLKIHVEIGKLPMVRNVLLKHAMDSGASHILWLDDDHVFPDWALARLTLAKKEIVGITQPSRSRPHISTAMGMNGKRVSVTDQSAKQGLIEQVASIGFPIVLMQMGIVAKLGAHAQQNERSLFPLFNFSLTDDPLSSGGEDAFFCSRCREAGIEIYLDHMLSLATVHMADLPVSLKDVHPSA